MECDRIFANVLFKDEPLLKKIWVTLPEHPLKRHNPLGDRHLIEKVPCLKLLSEFEKSIGVNFKHIRLLAKAFTRRNVPYNYLTLGNNQRLEFLGDTVLQLLTTEYLYKHFPYHQEGHLSLLRTCLVSNKTQSVVCDDLLMTNYLVIPQVLLRKGPQAQLRLKDKADLNEAFLGALFVDRGLIYCRQFCQTCFFPRLEYFIMTQRWNDPKSQLQQCCLALREGGTGDPDIPEYKTIGIEGPTNTRMYRVAVYFRNKRLADGVGHSVHQAQMQAAENALEKHAHIFPTFNTNQTKSQKENDFNNGNDQNYDKFDKDQSTNDGPEGRKSFTSMDMDRRKICKDSENDNRYLETSKTKLVGNQKGYKKTREEDGEKDRQSIPSAKRSRVLMRKEERRSSGTGTLDKSYVTPRIEAIHKVILKSQQQVNRFSHQLLKRRITKTSYISRRHSPETSHFFFNNTTPKLTQSRQTPMTIFTKMTNGSSPIVGQQSTNEFNLALLPPPPPPPPPPGPLSAPSSPLRPQNLAQLQSEPSSMPFVLAPPPPPPEMP